MFLLLVWPFWRLLFASHTVAVVATAVVAAIILSFVVAAGGATILALSRGLVVVLRDLLWLVCILLFLILSSTIAV